MRCGGLHTAAPYSWAVQANRMTDESTRIGYRELQSGGGGNVPTTTASVRMCGEEDQFVAQK